MHAGVLFILPGSKSAVGAEHLSWLLILYSTIITLICILCEFGHRHEPIDRVCFCYLIMDVGRTSLALLAFEAWEHVGPLLASPAAAQ